MRARGRFLLLIACTALLAAGCGAERVEPPRFDRASAPRGSDTYRSDTGDVRFRHPANWPALEADAPAVAHVISGPAVLTVWSYRRRVVPTTRAEADVAARRLVREIRRRNRSFRLRSRRVVRVAGGVAVELVGRGSVGAQKGFEIWSTHVYKRRGEYVIDAYAPRRDAALARREFGKILRSIRLGGRPETR